jgi:hypothetical protein
MLDPFASIRQAITATLPGKGLTSSYSPTFPFVSLRVVLRADSTAAPPRSWPEARARLLSTEQFLVGTNDGEEGDASQFTPAEEAASGEAEVPWVAGIAQKLTMGVAGIGEF